MERLKKLHDLLRTDFFGALWPVLRTMCFFPFFTDGTGMLGSILFAWLHGFVSFACLLVFIQRKMLTHYNTLDVAFVTDVCN